MIGLVLAMALGTAPAVANRASPIPAAAPVSAAARAREKVLKGKMANWRGNWRIAPDAIGCKTVTSTGDARLDLIGCRAVQVCYGAQLPAIAKVQAAPASDADKQTKITALLNAATPCIYQARAAAVEVLAGTRIAPRAAAKVKPG